MFIDNIIQYSNFLSYHSTISDHSVVGTYTKNVFVQELLLKYSQIPLLDHFHFLVNTRRHIFTKCISITLLCSFTKYKLFFFLV